MSEEHKICILDDFVKHCRLRPGLYCGDITDAQTIFKELIDNAIDEILNGYGNRIKLSTISLSDNNFGYLVQDNCGGIPIYPIPEYNNAIAAKLLITKANSSGKFDNSRYKYSCGLHGLGLTIVNSLSRRFILCSNDRKNNRVYRLETEQGKVVDERWIDYIVSEECIKSWNTLTTEKMENSLESINHQLGQPWWSTSVYSEPDETIFETTKAKLVSKSSLELISLLLNTEVILNDKIVDKFDPIQELGEGILSDKYYFIEVNCDSVKLMISFSWSSKEYDEIIKGAVNTSPCHIGLHVREVRNALGKVIENIDSNITSNDCRYGLRMFVSAFVSKPVFIGQIKYKLSEAKDWNKKNIESNLIEAFSKVFSENEEFKEAVIRRLLMCKDQFSKLNDMQYVNSIIKKGDDKRVKYGIGSEVYDCISSNREETELFIVEGKGAAGNLNKKRDRKKQAVLPLRGKLINILKLDEDIREIISNLEIRSMIKTIGVGIAPEEDLSQCRYGKIFICSDADPDGAQIEALILGAFLYLTPSLFNVGKIYIIQTPLYRQGGKFIWDEKDLIKGKKCDRFKGLGSMDADELFEAILDPATRKIKQVVLDNKSYAMDILSKAREKKDIMISNGIIIEEVYDKNRG